MIFETVVFKKLRCILKDLFTWTYLCGITAVCYKGDKLIRAVIASLTSKFHL